MKRLIVPDVPRPKLLHHVDCMHLADSPVMRSATQQEQKTLPTCTTCCTPKS
jgi:hypothetical protein